MRVNVQALNLKILLTEGLISKKVDMGSGPLSVPSCVSCLTSLANLAHFQSPSAVHFSGCWKRTILSLNQVIQLVAEEVLCNILQQLELGGILHSKPLGHTSSENAKHGPGTLNSPLMVWARISLPSVMYLGSKKLSRCRWKHR